MTTKVWRYQRANQKRKSKDKDKDNEKKREFVYTDDMLSLSQSWMLILTTSEYHVN